MPKPTREMFEKGEREYILILKLQKKTLNQDQFMIVKIMLSLRG